MSIKFATPAQSARRALWLVCDYQKLQNAVTAVFATADNYDDRIVALWGGKGALDRLAPKSPAN